MANRPGRHMKRHPSHGGEAERLPAAMDQQQLQRAMTEEEIAKTDAVAQAFEEDFEPVRDMVLLKMRNPRKTKGGLHLPDGVQAEELPLADVIASGPGMLTWNDKLGEHQLVPNDFKKGDVVFPFLKIIGNSAPSMQIGQNHYLLVSEGEILGKSKSKSQQVKEEASNG